MGILKEIAEKFCGLPEMANVIVSPLVIEKYRKICNVKFIYEDRLQSGKRILRNVSLGKEVYWYEGKRIIRYFDVNFEIHDNVIVNVWRNRKQYEIVMVDERIIEKWNMKYGIVSHRGYYMDYFNTDK